MDNNFNGPPEHRDDIKLRHLELNVLNALDELREADISTSMENVSINTTPVKRKVLCLRSRCESTEGSYGLALKEMGYELENFHDELSGLDVKSYRRTTVSSDFGIEHGGSENSSSSSDADYAQTAGGRTTDAYWDRDRKKLEALMISLRSCEAQNPLHLLLRRCEDENSLASKSHAYTNADVEMEEIMLGYKHSLHNTARLLIEVDKLYTQLEQIRLATDLDIKATAAIRKDLEGFGGDIKPTSEMLRCLTS